MEAFLTAYLRQLVPADCKPVIHVHQRKPHLLRKLEDRLRGYKHLLTEDQRVVVVVDLDKDDCQNLKGRMETAARKSGLLTRTAAQGRPWQVGNRIVIEELEAWYFGDGQAVRKACPRVPEHLPRRAKYRDPDAIRGGTREALERQLRQAGYCSGTGRLSKLQTARDIAGHIAPHRNRSRSFAAFHDAIIEATT